MDGQHPNQHDKRPKRRKDKDNPYELFTVGFGTPEPLYFMPIWTTIPSCPRQMQW